MIRFVTELADCQQLWDQVSPHQRAWDEWDLMYAFHDQKTYTLNFMVKEQDGKITGLIPLVNDTSDNSFELFGGCYPDCRVLWIEPGDFPEFFEQFPKDTVFFDLQGKWVEDLLQQVPQYEPNFAEADDQFYLEPADFDYDFVNHIQTFSSEKRKGFLYDLRKIRQRNLALNWSDDDESEAFIGFSLKNFGAESDHATDGGKDEVRRVVRELKESGYLKTLTIQVDGEVQAVSMSALYGDTWIALYSSSNNEINNLGKLLNVETIQEACRLRVREINYMTGMSWKAAWHMKRAACRTFRKQPKAPDPPPTP